MYSYCSVASCCFVEVLERVPEDLPIIYLRLVPGPRAIPSKHQVLERYRGWVGAHSFTEARTNIGVRVILSVSTFENTTVALQ
jgi:hypothetical protein